MKEPEWKTADEEVIWKYVAWHLAENGINTVLVGGAVCAIYSEGAYQSDCIRDRLASYIYFKVRECLDQAVLVAKKCPFKKAKVKKWCESEGATEVYKEFISKLEK